MDGPISKIELLNNVIIKSPYREPFLKIKVILFRCYLKISFII